MKNPKLQKKDLRFGNRISAKIILKPKTRFEIPKQNFKKQKNLKFKTGVSLLFFTGSEGRSDGVESRRIFKHFRSQQMIEKRNRRLQQTKRQSERKNQFVSSSFWTSQKTRSWCSRKRPSSARKSV